MNAADTADTVASAPSTPDATAAPPPGETAAPTTLPPADIEERIARAIIERLELEGYSADTIPREGLLFGPPERGGFGLDSIASMEILSALSDEFNLPFDDVAREDLFTIRSLAAYVDHHLAQARGAA